MSERHLRLKAPGEGGHSQYFHNGCGVACNQDSPDVYVSDEEAETLLETGKFEDLGTVDGDVTESSSAEDENTDVSVPDETDSGSTDEDDGELTFSAQDYAEPGESVEAEADDGEEICGATLTSGETCERPADACPYHGD